MNTNEYLKEIKRLRAVVDKLKIEGPVRMKHPVPGEPDIILTAEDTEEMLNSMENVARAYMLIK